MTYRNYNGDVSMIKKILAGVAIGIAVLLILGVLVLTLVGL